ncbi:MAG: dTDP-glucose 4,6-dehydratase [Lachnospiraceae bacterium]|nr:dTDP-glucose 4,6-dehydratase [Lachnospiraceae bacterium]
MKYLVTGAAGFIGSNFVYHMLEKHKGDLIVGIDNLSYAGNIKNLGEAEKNSNFIFRKADITDEKGMAAIFEEFGFDYVINFAAQTHVDRSIDDPGIFVRTNVIGTQILLDLARKHNIKRFHQIGTDEVYGDLPLEATDSFFVETLPLKTSSPYSASKAASDLLALSYNRTFGLSVTVSRCSNNYGPFQFPEKFIPLMLINAMNDKHLPVYGDGMNVRDWLYVEDHCEAVDLILHNGRDGEIYNIGGHNEMHNIDIVKLILKELGKPESLISYVKDRKGHDLRYAIDPTKIHNELGWLPKTKFADGIKSTIRWYVDNKEWWEEIVSGEFREYYKKMYGDL